MKQVLKELGFGIMNFKVLKDVSRGRHVLRIVVFIRNIQTQDFNVRSLMPSLSRVHSWGP